jgi:Phytochelatin synthase
LASVSLALKGLGINCSIDAIFSALRLPTSWVVHEGLTLAQVFDVMVKLCGSTNSSEILAPGIAVECFHFDSATANFTSFVDYLKASLSDEDDVLIANFSTRVCRDFQGGGGHFSLISGFDATTNTVSIADVHPKKYGAHWACSVRKLFDSMVDQDSGIKRSRGMIRVAFARADHIASLDDCRHTISYREHRFAREEQEWLARWGDLPVGSFESHLNMGGLSSLGLCLSGFLSDSDYENLALQNHIPADFIAWQLRLSITELLGNIMSPRKLTNCARRISESLMLDLDIQCEEVDCSTPIALASCLETRVGRATSSVALILVDVNEAYGFEVSKPADKNSEAAILDHGVQHWCVLVSVPDQQTAIIADPRAKTFGRLWKCKMENLRNGLLGAKTNPGHVVFFSMKGYDC